MQQLLPIELVFNPNWWYETAGISFDEAFYLDPATRIRDDVTMRRVLWERYRDLGLGEEDPQPRPVIGSLHVAGGFVIPALLGAEIRFAPDAAPQPLPRTVTAQEIDAFEKPDFRTSWPMRELLAQMDDLRGGVRLRDRRRQYRRRAERCLSLLRPGPVRRLLPGAGACAALSGHHRRADCGRGAGGARTDRQLFDQRQPHGGAG